MAYIKVHIVPNQEISLEGDNEAIERVLDKYFPPTPIISSSQTTSQTDSPSPSLHDLVYKSLPKSEAEWLIIYAYYLDKPEFTRQEIIASYKSTQRYTHNHSKNLSFNLKTAIKNTWIRAISATTFALTPTGNSHIQTILSRNA